MRQIKTTVSGNIDGILRVVNMLKQKNFQVTSMNMEVINDKTSDLVITLDEEDNRIIDYLIKCMKKLISVIEIRVLN